MAEQPTTLFDPPAGDRPASRAYQPGAWLAAPPPAGEDEDAAPPSASRRLVQPDRHRLLLHRLLEAEERLAGHDPGSIGVGLRSEMAQLVGVADHAHGLHEVVGDVE